MARICLDMLRSRKLRREQSLSLEGPDEPVVSREAGLDPEREALLADSVGPALLAIDIIADPQRLRQLEVKMLED